jgi:hypothetical protein
LDLSSNCRNLTHAMYVSGIWCPSCTNSSWSRSLARFKFINVNMSCHITKTCGAAFYWLHNIKRISKFLSRENLLTVIYMPLIVTSRMDYYNGLLYGLPNTELIKLERVQNAAARLVTSTRKYDHITPILRELHWLPVKFRIHFKLLYCLLLKL